MAEDYLKEEEVYHDISNLTQELQKETSPEDNLIFEP